MISIVVMASITMSREKKHHMLESTPSRSRERTGTFSEHPLLGRFVNTEKNNPSSAAAPGKYCLPTKFEKTEPKITARETGQERE